jgi:peptidoglycan/xylan/chitin deacetylase (PgdA/CDA1 family)
MKLDPLNIGRAWRLVMVVETIAIILLIPLAMPKLTALLVPLGGTENISITSPGSKQTIINEFIISAQLPYDVDMKEATIYLDGKPLMKAFAADSGAVASLVFDDGWLDVYSKAYPILRRANVNATVAVIRDYTGNKGALNLRQLRILHESGWEMASHSTTDRPLVGLALEDLDSALAESQLFLERNGFVARHLMLPHGLFNEEILNRARHYYKSARSYNPGINTGQINPFNLSVVRLEFSTTREEIEPILKQIVREQGWVIFVAHHVSEIDDINRFNISPDLLEYLVDTINDSNIPFVTYDEAFQKKVEGEASIVGSSLKVSLRAHIMKPGPHSLYISDGTNRSKSVEFNVRAINQK